jgi:hypothetical protein
MMKRFIPDAKNNVLLVDSNGITKIDHCGSAEECFYICDRLNEVESNEKQRNSSKHTNKDKDRFYN